MSRTASARSAALALPVVLGMLGALMSAGCAALSKAAPGLATSPPPVGAISALNNTRSQLLPIEQYLIAPSENSRIEQARAQVISSCMKRFGFAFTPDPLDSRKKVNQTVYRYDPTDAAVAASRGYHSQQSLSQESGMAEPSESPMSSQMEAVLGHGIEAPNRPGSLSPSFDGSYKGRRIPVGGCVGEADHALTAHGGIIQDSPAVVNINFTDYARSMADYRVKAVFAKWSRCMRARGYSYPTPEAADDDPRWRSAEPSALELATATADVACKQQNNVVGIWFAVESAYESRDIRVNARQLAQVRRDIDVTLRNADAITGHSGS